MKKSRSTTTTYDEREKFDATRLTEEGSKGEGREGSIRRIGVSATKPFKRKKGGHDTPRKPRGKARGAVERDKRRGSENYRTEKVIPFSQ